MPSGRFEHIFLYSITAAVNNGNPLFNAEGLRTGQNSATKANQGQYPWNLLVRVAVTDTTSGGQWTFLVQDAPYPGTAWTTRDTIVLQVKTGQTMRSHRVTYKAKQPCFRVVASAVTGGSAPTAWAYGTPGYYGI